MSPIFWQNFDAVRTLALLSIPKLLFFSSGVIIIGVRARLLLFHIRQTKNPSIPTATNDPSVAPTIVPVEGPPPELPDVLGKQLTTGQVSQVRTEMVQDGGGSLGLSLSQLKQSAGPHSMQSLSRANRWLMC